MDDHSTILTPRQFQIAKLVADDLTDKEIAALLGISKQTVKNILINVRTRLGAASRVGVAVIVSTHPIIVRDMSGQGQRR